MRKIITSDGMPDLGLKIYTETNLFLSVISTLNEIGLKETSGMKKQELQLINTKIHSIERIILTIL